MMNRTLLVVCVCVVVLALLGCAYPRMQIVGKLDADEGPVYTVRDAYQRYDAVPIPGTGRMPPIGLWCRFDGYETLDCGRYADLHLIFGPPA